MDICEMKISDYEPVYVLWRKTEGVGLHDDVDSQGSIARYLQRNPGLSLVVREDDKIVAAVLCGHDGRRGYLNHLAVDPAYRQRGIGKAIVEKVLEKLHAIGISRCNILVYANNHKGQRFWDKNNWITRSDLKIMYKDTDIAKE